MCQHQRSSAIISADLLTSSVCLTCQTFGLMVKKPGMDQDQKVFRWVFLLLKSSLLACGRHLYYINIFCLFDKEKY